MIKRLRDHLNDIPTFIHSLSILIFFEQEMDETLLDLYHYYCTIGLTSSSPHIRAACVGMYTAFLSFDPALVLSGMHVLSTWRNSNWWEISAQLLIVASGVLASDDDAASSSSSSVEDTVVIDQALDIIFHEFHPKALPTIRYLGLSYLAKLLSRYAELVPVYCQILRAEPLEHIETLLSRKIDGKTYHASRSFIKVYKTYVRTRV